jgi:hypothetical protein
MRPSAREFLLVDPSIFRQDAPSRTALHQSQLLRVALYRASGFVLWPVCDLLECLSEVGYRGEADSFCSR